MYSGILERSGKKKCIATEYLLFLYDIFVDTLTENGKPASGKLPSSFIENYSLV